MDHACEQSVPEVDSRTHMRHPRVDIRASAYSRLTGNEQSLVVGQVPEYNERPVRSRVHVFVGDRHSSSDRNVIT